MLVDNQNEETVVTLNNLLPDQGLLEVSNSTY